MEESRAQCGGSEAASADALLQIGYAGSSASRREPQSLSGHPGRGQTGGGVLAAEACRNAFRSCARCTVSKPHPDCGRSDSNLCVGCPPYCLGRHIGSRFLSGDLCAISPRAHHARSIICRSFPQDRPAKGHRSGGTGECLLARGASRHSTDAVSPCRDRRTGR